MFLAAKVLNGNILACNDNLPSQQLFLVQQFPDNSLSILTMTTSLKILFLQPGNTAYMAKRDWQILGGNSQKRNLAGEKRMEKTTLLGQKSLRR